MTTAAEDGGQHWDPERYQRNAGFVAEHGLALVDLLAPRPGQRVLDLGCGDGALTIWLNARGCSVVAVDASPEQVAAAAARGLDARVMDGQALDFDSVFDGALSNAALHWMPDLPAVLDGVRRALKPGARFVCEMGGEGNVAAIRTALHTALEKRGMDPRARDPWTFPSVERMRDMLESAGLRVESLALVPRPQPLPTSLMGWLETFAEPFLKGLTEPARAELLQEVVALAGPSLRGADGAWTADYVRLRFVASRPGDEA